MALVERWQKENLEKAHQVARLQKRIELHRGEIDTMMMERRQDFLRSLIPDQLRQKVRKGLTHEQMAEKLGLHEEEVEQAAEERKAEGRGPQVTYVREEEGSPGWDLPWDRLAGAGTGGVLAGGLALLLVLGIISD